MIALVTSCTTWMGVVYDHQGSRHYREDDHTADAPLNQLVPAYLSITFFNLGILGGIVIRLDYVAVLCKPYLPGAVCQRVLVAWLADV